MFLTEQANEIFSKLMTWAEENHVRTEAASILARAASTLVNSQLRGDLRDGDGIKLFVAHILTAADYYGYGARAEAALRAVGLGEHIPPTSAQFDVAFAGIKLRLTLPLKRDGQVSGTHSVESAVLEAMGAATVTPVTADTQNPEPEAAEVE